METVTTKTVDLANPITFFFDLPDNRGNAKGHRYYDHFSERKWSKRATARNIETTMRERHKFPLPGARWHLDAFLHGHQDFDNLIARLKWVFDWMVDLGAVPDDSERYLWPLDLPTQTVNRKEEPRFVVTLYPVKETHHAKRVFAHKIPKACAATRRAAVVIGPDDCGPGDREE